MSEQTGGHRTASGVETLIARLRDEGVGAGRDEAERIVAEAQALARATVEEAQLQAADTLERARRQAANLQRAGEDALKAAARDAVLDRATVSSGDYRPAIYLRAAHRPHDATPGVLIEVEFLSNPAVVEGFLMRPESLDIIARGLMRGVLSYYQTP